VTLPQVGGLSGLVDKLSAMPGPGGVNYLAMLPDFTSNWDLAVAVFIMPMAVQWWAVWYPGAERGWRKLHRAADAGVEVRARRSGRDAVLQPRALRTAAVAVDSHRAGVDHRVSDAARYFRRRFRM